MTIQEYIKKLQGFPEQKKKIIIISVIVVSALIMLFFSIKDTQKSISKIGESLKSVTLPQIDFVGEGRDLPKIDLDSIAEGVAPQNQDSDLLSYKNGDYGFELKYPKSWLIDDLHTSNTELSLFKDTAGAETAGLHLEVTSQTQKVKLAQAGIDNIILKMKNVVAPKKVIKVGAYSGYEVIGTLCTQMCTGSDEDMYTPFSIIYFSDGIEVFELQYGESVFGLGWKDGVKDWKYYNEFKNIVSTFRSDDGSMRVTDE